MWQNERLRLKKASQELQNDYKNTGYDNTCNYKINQAMSILKDLQIDMY
jgi:hypothetical protein